MNRKILITAVISTLLALSQTTFGKAHVPSGKAQLCVDGRVVTVSNKVVRAFTNRGTHGAACVLPACDFNNVFVAGGATECAGLTDDDNDGFCDLPNPRDSAEGITPACPNGTF